MATQIDTYEMEQQVVEQIRRSRSQIDAELEKVIVGQKEVIEQLLITLFSGGHCLITGAPGLAKTLLVRSIAQMFHLKFQRIQFTPDLMPADITGTEILEDTGDGRRRMQFVRGPIFANVILADEINRTPPKTQAALLEAMQEHQVTAAGVRYPLDEPFFVLATQNPIEMEGTYPLPEAQLDRFMFNVVIDYLPEDDEVEVVRRTTSEKPQAIDPQFDGEDVLRFQEMVRRVPIAFNNTFIPQQKIYFALDAMGKIPEVHEKVFRAIHVERQRLNKDDEIFAFMEKQGVDGAKFKEVYNSFSVASQVRKATQLQEAYGVEGVPACRMRPANQNAPWPRCGCCRPPGDAPLTRATAMPRPLAMPRRPPRPGVASPARIPTVSWTFRIEG